MAQQQQLQALSEAMQKFQDGRATRFDLRSFRTCTDTSSDLQGAVEARQKLEAQQSENQAVKKEFDALDEEAGIYKLVGPVLLKQERTEAVSAVDGRLDFIGKEINRTEDRIKELETAADNKRVELMQLQQKMQMAAQGQASG